MKLPFITVMTAAFSIAAAHAADLPVRQVILYKNGVGYFERAGQLRAGESARLEFKATDMDDVLKSLTIGDQGGKVSGVRYDSSEPLAAQLGRFPFRLDGQVSLAAFLDQIRAARIQLVYGAEKVRGAIVSARATAADEKRAEKEQVVLMVDSGELRTLDLGGASALRVSDPSLQSKLKDYLAALDKSRSSERRSVYIDSSETKEREISAGYMLPSAVWKSSYRLIFAESGRGESGQPTLEGWAIVDNTSGEDWTNVRLALVSGRPVSFISPLYQPKYVQRQTVDLAGNQAQGPVVYEGGMTVGALAAAAPPPPPSPASMAKAMRPMAAADSVGERNESTVAVATQGRDLGDLFEYNFATPVTVKSNESAMLPFVQQKISARKLLIYTDGSGLNPMNAAEITNTTGKTLDGGPITVFDSGAYAGEALMETLKAADKRLISYGVDLGTRVTTLFDSSRELVREIHVRRGVLTTRIASEETKTYTIRNIDAKTKTLIIEHAERPGYKLLNQKPSETTSNAYRFEVKLAANATDKFPVAEERVYDTTTAVSSLTPDTLLTYTQNKALSDAARRQLEQILDEKRRIAGASAQLESVEAQIKSLTQEEQRMRQNIASLNNVSGQQEQVQRYARQLGTEETRMAALRDQASELGNRKSALESELNSLIEKMDF